VGGDLGQVSVERPALGIGERGEQVFLDLLRSLSGLLEPAAATRGETDEVTTPVDRVAAANDESLGFEAVDDGHQVAGVDAERLTEATLRDRTVLREAVEDGEVVGMHIELAERRAEAHRRCAPQAKDQQVASARIGGAIEGGSWARGRRAHLAAMLPSDNDLHL